MGNYNYFFAECVCPTCGSTVTADFQGIAGILQFKDFQLGDSILEKDIHVWKGRVGPDMNTLLENRDFWVYGVAECPVCSSYIWAKLFFRNGKFAQAHVVEEPANTFDWGILDE